MNTTATKQLAGRYRTADGKAMIEWSVEQKENGPEFSASGEYDRGGGQNIDKIAEAYPNDRAVQRIAKVWREWHLNGMNAGTPEQMAYLRANDSKIERGDYYGSACALLKAAGLYEIQLTPGELQATGGFENRSDPLTQKLIYRYGERWIYRPIPVDVLAEIESWGDFTRKDSRSLGECQTEEFLKRNGIACRIALSDTKPAQWEPAGHHYRVTLSAKRRRLTFDFWGSAHDASEDKDPSPHRVFSCIASDIHTPDTFEDFCSEYGEDTDSRKALQTFRRAAKHAERLRAFFTDSEREEMAELY